MESYIGYMLQITTITITLLLGIFGLVQTKKIQKGQNIVSITTNYRMQRSEQIKQYGHVLLAQSSPELLKISKETALKMAEKTHSASAHFHMILHRCFEQDLELMSLAEQIAKTVTEYVNALHYSMSTSKKTLARLKKKLIGYRKIFTIKCDIYTYAEWNRIKKETGGVNTASQEWINNYQKLLCKYEKELSQVLEAYKDVIESDDYNAVKE